MLVNWSTFQSNLKQFNVKQDVIISCPRYMILLPEVESLNSESKEMDPYFTRRSELFIHHVYYGESVL